MNLRGPRGLDTVGSTLSPEVKNLEMNAPRLPRTVSSPGSSTSWGGRAGARAVVIAGLAGLLAVLGAAGAVEARTGAASPRAHGVAGRAPVHGSQASSRRRAPAHGARGRKAVAVVHRIASVRSGLPNVQALGALVLDENGHELYARNADAERPIASISKLAATLTVMDRGLELEGLSTITKVDIEVARGGARSRLLEGITLSNRDLLHAALMGSDNRAIPALGRAVRLTPTQLAMAMTAKAKELGLSHTRFHDPTGLSVENVSTPRETIAMLQAVMRHPVLGPITRRVEYEAHPVGRPPILYVNTYRPAIRGNLEVLGGKTGYNDDARYCLVLAAKVEGKTCFMAFLSNEGKMTRFGDVARVADWIIARRPKVLAATAPAGPATLPGDATADTGERAAVGPTPVMLAAPAHAWILTPPRAGAVRTASTPRPASPADAPLDLEPAAASADAPSSAPGASPESPYEPEGAASGSGSE
jgi:D-alanyl-D-alanine endopeptidase (penicillin-binding protein 7)